MGELVPGDIVYLSAGDMIPADVRVVAAKDLFISQSALTGEALPVEKAERAPIVRDRVLRSTELPTVCFMGTSVVSGTATGGGRRDRRAGRQFGSHGQGARRSARRRRRSTSACNKVSWLFIRFIAGDGADRLSASTGSPRTTGSRRCCSRSPSRSASRPRCCR